MFPPEPYVSIEVVYRAVGACLKMRAKVLWSSLCAGFLLTSVGASAQETLTFEAFQSGNWRGSTHFQKTNESFSHCSMSASYKSGISLFFAIDKELKWRIGFANEKWNLKTGQSYDIAYVIDNFPVNTSSAVAISSKFAIAELPATSQVFHQFRIGRMFVVREGNGFLRFSLDGTSRALSSLLACANEGKLRTASDYRPFGGTHQAAAPTAPSQSSSAEEKLEATQFVANVLSTGELRDYKILTSSETNKPDMPDIVRTAAVVWSAPSSLGMLHIIPNGAGNIDTLVGGVIGSDAEACKGTFASGKIPDADLPKVRRVFTTCSTENKDSNHIEYIFVPRPNGSVYRFGTATIASGETPKTDGQGLREALKKAVFNN